MFHLLFYQVEDPELDSGEKSEARLAKPSNETNQVAIPEKLLQQSNLGQGKQYNILLYLQ
jgi:hypothetical protein